MHDQGACTAIRTPVDEFLLRASGGPSTHHVGVQSHRPADRCACARRSRAGSECGGADGSKNQLMDFESNVNYILATPRTREGAHRNKTTRQDTRCSSCSRRVIWPTALAGQAPL